MFTFAADQAQTVLKVQLQHFYLKIRKRYKLVVLQNDTFTEKLSINAPLWQFISWSLALLLLLILVLVVLIKGTSLREYIIGSDVSTNRKELVEAYARIDSLSQKVQDNDAYHALACCDGLIITGPTGTNVNDVAVALLRNH